MEPSDRSHSDVRIAVIGLGGIGCALLPRLLRMPFSVIALVDGDRVEESNLERQELYAEVDIDRPKVEVAAAWARNAPVLPLVLAIDAFIGVHNAENLIAKYDVIADCTDDLHVRRLIDRVCGDLGVLLVTGAVHAQQGQVIVLHAEGDREELLLEGIFPGKPGTEQDGCDMRHVPLNVLDGTAKRMAWRIREWLSGEMLVNGRVEQYDGASDTWMELQPPGLP
jgi:molybdopterin/thiamine biosynthesis adenylyltransferase